MKCVQCDSKMKYIKGSESNNWKTSHWLCPDCSYSETDGERVDINITNESYSPKK